MKVMLVEDDRAVMMVTTAYIESFGHEVVPAVSGEIALEIFDPNHIDLVVMDFLLPGIDGVETTRTLRDIYEDEWFPIIFLTSSNDDTHLAECLEAGADDYLCKPVKPIVLESKIKAICRLVKMQKDLVHANNKLEQLSYLDGLTHIFNRRGFDQVINTEWNRMHRDKNTLSFLMIDVDYFKKYNDHYGHQAGDECLRVIAATLDEQLFRPADVVARYGGEEFSVLLPGTANEGAIEVAERVIESIQAIKLPHAASGISSYITISIGIASTDSKINNNIPKLVKSADQALYQAKTNGRNQCYSGVSSASVK